MRKIIIAISIVLLTFGAAYAAADLEIRLLNSTGSGQAQSDPDNSLTGYCSTTELSETAMNNLFDNVLPAEASGGDIEYRALDIYNLGDELAESVLFFLDQDTTSGYTDLDLAVEATPHGVDTSVSSLASESSTSGLTITFSDATYVSPITIDSIPAGYCVRAYVRRVVAAGAISDSNDNAVIGVQW